MRDLATTMIDAHHPMTTRKETNPMTPDHDNRKVA